VKSSIRPSTPDDASALLSLMAEAGLSANTSAEEQRWKYWQERPDWPGSRSFVMTRGSEILAHAAIVPGVFATDTHRFSVIHLIDWAARPSATGAGVSLMKHVGRLTDALLAIGGSAQTLKILPHLGFRPCGRAMSYVRTLRPLRILTPSVHNHWRILPRLARSAYWTLTAPSLNTDGWQARPIALRETAAITAVFPTPTRDMAVLERSESLLRYVLQCPSVPMELFALEQGGAVRGYFLLGFAARQARLVDCWVQSTDPADWRALLNCAVLQAKRRPRVAELVAWASDPILSGCMLECGFHARGSQEVGLLAADKSNFPSATVRLQMLDNDAAYRHLGRAEFLA
jgi:hypothetical protein